MKSTLTTKKGYTEGYVRADLDNTEAIRGFPSELKSDSSRDSGHNIFRIGASPATGRIKYQPNSLSEALKVNGAHGLHQALKELQMHHTVTPPDSTGSSQSSDPYYFGIDFMSAPPSDNHNQPSSLMDSFMDTSQGIMNISHLPSAGLHQYRPIVQPENVMNTTNHQPFFPSLITMSSFLRAQTPSYITNKGPMMSQASPKPEFWRGDRDSTTGTTPYHKCTEFMKAETIITQLRQNPNHMIDHATIFTDLRDVKNWKKSLQNPATFEDPGIPCTEKEKQAMVKLMFSAFKSVSHAVSNPGTMRAYNKQHHNNAYVEAICWELLEDMIARHEGGPVSEVYNGKSRNTNMSFAQRINEAVTAMAEEKSICDNLLRAPKIKEFVDDPVFTKNRTRNNRGLNAKKKETMEFGKREMAKLGLLPHKRPSKRSREEVPEVETEGTDEDCDEDSETEHSGTSERIPARRYVTPTKPSIRNGAGRARAYKMEPSPLQQQTPSSTAAAFDSYQLDTPEALFPGYYANVNASSNSPAFQHGHAHAAQPYIRVYPQQSSSFPRNVLAQQGLQFRSSFESPPSMTTLTSEFDPLEYPSAYFPSPASSPDFTDGSIAPPPSPHEQPQTTSTGIHELNYEFMSTGPSNSSFLELEDFY